MQLCIAASLAIVFFSDVGGEGCEPCVVIHPLDSPDNDPTLVGTYSLMTDNSSCPRGCAYSKEGDPDTWCFSEGPYSHQYPDSCPISTEGTSTVQTTAEEEQGADAEGGEG